MVTEGGTVGLGWVSCGHEGHGGLTIANSCHAAKRSCQFSREGGSQSCISAMMPSVMMFGGVRRRLGGGYSLARRTCTLYSTSFDSCTVMTASLFLQEMTG